MLLFFSIVFYAWGEPKYVFLMLFSIFVDYTHGILVYKYRNLGQIKKARLILISSCIINLSLLFFFKYSNFLIEMINSVFNLSVNMINVSLPLGISFYTFQTMSYTIDIYKGEAEPQRNIIDFGAYVSLFPQLIAGPIVKYKTISKEIKDRESTVDDFALGIQYFIIGLGKKVLLANSIGAVFESIKSMNNIEMSIVSAWLGIIAYGMQIYFDFSGYSDMAIGLGRIFGFKFPRNFNYPYISKSITEFWRRWHMTLGSWFKEYVYIPLGGNKKGLKLQLRNIMIVWLLTGLWHGASMNFVLWGVYYGVILMIEKVFLLKRMEGWKSIYKHIYSIFFILIGWTVFAFDSMVEMKLYFKYLFDFIEISMINKNTLYIIKSNIILFVICIISVTPLMKNLFNKIKEKYLKSTWSITMATNIYYIFIFILSVAYLVDATYNPFLYFRF